MCFIFLMNVGFLQLLFSEFKWRLHKRKTQSRPCPQNHKVKGRTRQREGEGSEKEGRRKREGRGPPAADGAADDLPGAGALRHEVDPAEGGALEPGAAAVAAGLWL